MVAATQIPVGSAQRALRPAPAEAVPLPSRLGCAEQRSDRKPRSGHRLVPGSRPHRGRPGTSTRKGPAHGSQSSTGPALARIAATMIHPETPICPANRTRVAATRTASMPSMPINGIALVGILLVNESSSTSARTSERREAVASSSFRGAAKETASSAGTGSALRLPSAPDPAEGRTAAWRPRPMCRASLRSHSRNGHRPAPLPRPVPGWLLSWHGRAQPGEPLPGNGPGRDLQDPARIFRSAARAPPPAR